MLRMPNSLRVGNVSDTFASPVNHAPYMASRPNMSTKFCCADNDSVMPLAVGSTVEASMTLGLVTVRNSSPQAVTPSASMAPAAVRETVRAIFFMYTVTVRS